MLGSSSSKSALIRRPANARPPIETFRGTKREAQARLVELQSEAARGTLVDYRKETLGQFLERWDGDWAAINVSPKTRERWNQLRVNQVNPALGNAPLQRLEASHLAALYATLMREGGVGGGPLAAKTVGHVHRLLRRALGHALAWKLIQHNPAAVARPPRVVDDEEIDIPTEAEIAVVLARLRDSNPLLYALAVLALATGARRGELCALTWKDFDADTGLLRIERSVEATAEGERVKGPKTRHGKRAIGLPASTVRELGAHWKAQQEERLKSGLGRATPEDPIFATADGSPLRPNTLSRNWLRSTGAVGRPINLHSLRHHHASNLIAAGLDVLTVSRRLGHGSPTITLAVYGHLYPRADDRAAQAIEAMFERVALLTPTDEGARHG